MINPPPSMSRTATYSPLRKSIRAAALLIVTATLLYLLSAYRRNASTESVNQCLARLMIGPRQQDPDVVRALRALGTNAVPQLASVIGNRDSAFRPMLLKICPESWASKLGFADGTDQRQKAVTAFWILGDIAAPSAPSLWKALERGHNPESTTEALLAIGPEGACFLTNILSAGSLQARRVVTAKISDYPFDFASRRSELPQTSQRFNSAAQHLVPLLANLARDKDTTVRSLAARGLGAFKFQADLSLPVLINLLDDPEARPRREAVQSLTALGDQAKQGVPALLTYINRTQDLTDRVTAITAIWHIDPTAAASAGFEIHVLPSAGK